MANIDVRGFATIVGNIAAAAQGRALALLDYSVGSVLRSIAEAEAGVSLWLQGVILQVLATSRLATSQGADVDSFINEWGTERLGAALSAGQVTFSRFTPTAQAIIPVNAQVATSDLTQTFQVVADSTNSSYSAALNGYILPASVSQVSCPVQAMIPGVAANVAANTITVLITSIVGVDYCNNAGAMSGGTNAESDPQAKARFPLYIQSLSEGTIEAIQYAVQSLKLGMQATVLENLAPNGVTAYPGYLTITVDDGSGYPPSSTLTAAGLAIGNARAGGVMWGVFPPVVLSTNMQITITTAPGFDHPTVVGIVNSAVTTFVNALPLGQSLPFTQLSSIIYGSSPGVTNAQYTINGGTADVVATQRNVIKTGILTVS